MIGITVVGGCVRKSCGPSSASTSSGPPIGVQSKDSGHRDQDHQGGEVWDVDRFECKTFTRTVRQARAREQHGP